MLGFGEKAMVMTFSEFGGKGYRGMDHSTMAPMMLFGAKVNGELMGENDQLNSLGENGLQPNTKYDYRQIYPTVLQKWLGINDEVIEQLNYKHYLKLAPQVL